MKHSAATCKKNNQTTEKKECAFVIGRMASCGSYLFSFQNLSKCIKLLDLPLAPNRSEQKSLRRKLEDQQHVIHAEEPMSKFSTNETMKTANSTAKHFLVFRASGRSVDRFLEKQSSPACS